MPLYGLCFGFDDFTCPDGTWLVFPSEGNTIGGVPDALGQTWDRVYGEFLPQCEYKQADLPTIENYVVWDEAKGQFRVEVWIPVEK